MNQQDAKILTNNLYYTAVTCSTCFGRNTRPSSGALFSELYHAVGTFVQASLAATSDSTPDDGRVVRPKHAQQVTAV